MAKTLSLFLVYNQVYYKLIGWKSETSVLIGRYKSPKKTVLYKMPKCESILLH